MTVSRTMILGGSRGLGKAIADRIPDSFALSRKSELSVDLSKPESIGFALDQVSELKIQRIIYAAGGGPHGPFFEKSPESHAWAYNVNLFTPIGILNGLIEKGYQGEFVYIGSAIAERSTSNHSLSYSTSKKSARDIILSNSNKSPKSLVFSPPFMNTDLLPQGSWPRLEHPDLVVEPAKVAGVLLGWLDEQSGNSDSRHFDWIDRFDYSLPKDKDI